MMEKGEMDIPKEVDDFLKETTQESLGLPVSTDTLRVKLRVVEDSYRRLAEQQLLLHERLRRKEQLIECAKAEATMNAVALKKFVEENQRLAAECAVLVSQCQKWENECSLYDKDREALMDFGNEADERAKEAERRARELQEALEKVSEDMKFYKNEYESHKATSCDERNSHEEILLDSFLGNFVNEEDSESDRTLLEKNQNDDCCQLLSIWDRLRPSSRKALLLAAKMTSLQNDKENLRINLKRAEEEANLLFKENNLLEEENKKLVRQINSSPAEKFGSNASSVKSNKRKSSCRMSNALDMKISECKETEAIRHPLSPLRHNSAECRMYKK